jgi:hypothetical protein
MMFKVEYFKHQRKRKAFSWPREQSSLGTTKMEVLL